MNICLLPLDYPSQRSGGGVGNQAYVLGRHLSRAGHRVTIIALGKGRVFNENGRFKVYWVQPGNWHWYVYRLPFLGPWMALALRELEYGWAIYRRVQALHEQEAFELIEGTETGCFWVALRMKQVPLILRLHGDEYTCQSHTPKAPPPSVRLARILQRAALRRAHVLISPSRAHAQAIAGELGLPHPPIQIIPNCINVEMLTRRNHVTREKAMVLFAGRLQAGKGIRVLLEAANLVLREFPKARFVLAGATHPSLAWEQIEAMISGYRLTQRVRRLGHVPWEQLASWYRRATICAIPSYYETFGIVALESMALGTPVVASRAGGLPEVIEDGVTGLLVPPGDAQALAQALLRLLRSPELCRRLGQAGQRRATQFFSVEKILALNENAYQGSSRWWERNCDGWLKV